MAAILRRFCRSKGGATAIEYGLIAAVITAVLIVGFNRFASENNRIYEYVDESVSNAVGGIDS